VARRRFAGDDAGQGDQLQGDHPSAGRQIGARYNLVCVAYDRAFIKSFTARCEEDGVRLPLKEYGQGFVSMSPAVQLLEAAVLDKRIHHGGHPILRWQMSNVAIEMDSSANRKPSKKRAIGHIDGVVAALMALAIAEQPQPMIDVAALIG
jgi:phage terminase large subunit-like protein